MKIAPECNFAIFIDNTSVLERMLLSDGTKILFRLKTLWSIYHYFNYRNRLIFSPDTY